MPALRVLDTFSGIGGGTKAFEDAGCHTVAVSEIEEFTSAVLKHHFPNVENLGDVTQYEEWPEFVRIGSSIDRIEIRIHLIENYGELVEYTVGTIGKIPGVEEACTILGMLGAKRKPTGD